MNLGGGTLQPTATFSSSVPLTLTSTSTIDTPGSNTATFSGIFSGAGGLNKTGSGTLVLGTPAGTAIWLYGAYTGDTRIYGGVLALTSENDSYPLYSSCLDYNNYGGSIVFQGAYNHVNIGGLKGNQDLVMNDQSGYGIYLQIMGGFNTTYSGVLSETGETSYYASLIQHGTGSLTLSGQSTFYGGYPFSAVELWTGALVAGASSTGVPGSVTSGPFGAGSIDLSGGTLSSNGNWTIANALKFGNYNYGYNVTLGDTSANTLTLTGDATLSHDMVLTTPGNGVTMSGSISGGYGITKAGSGTLTLTGANSYTGPTTISAGTLQFTGGGTLGTGDVTNNGALLFNYATGTTTVTNNIAGAGTLTKSGAGTLVFSGGSLSYTGRTTITAGMLEAVGAGGLGLLAGNGGLDIQGGKALLDYTGLVDPATLDSLANTLMQEAHANGWAIDAATRSARQPPTVIMCSTAVRPAMPWAGRTQSLAARTC